jgi:hypothetical protein
MQGRRDDLVAALLVMGLVLVSWGACESDERRWIWRRVGGGGDASPVRWPIDEEGGSGAGAHGGSGSALWSESRA